MVNELDQLFQPVRPVAAPESLEPWHQPVFPGMGGILGALDELTGYGQKTNAEVTHIIQETIQFLVQQHGIEPQDAIVQARAIVAQDAVTNKWHVLV